MYLIFDGGNGGQTSMQGYGSFKLYDRRGGNLIVHIDRYKLSGLMTNNEAEYHTLILALEWINDHIDDPEFVYGPLEIEGDSELVRNQVLGNWRIKVSHLQPLRDRVVSLLNLYTNYTYTHIPRKAVLEHLGH